MNETAPQDTASDERGIDTFPLHYAAVRLGLKSVELALYVAIVSFVNHATHTAFPSMSLLAATAGMSEKTVERTLPKLEARGLIQIIRNSTRGHHYLLTDPRKLVPDRESETTDTESAIPDSATETGGTVFPSESREAAGDLSVRESETSDSTTESDPAFPSESREFPTESRPNKQMYVVVEESKTLPKDQQQQDPPRPVTSPERAIFQEMHIAPTLWETWLHHDADHVLACALHAQAEGDNPPGLLRAMLEKDSGAPKAMYIETARMRLSGMASLEEALQAAHEHRPAPSRDLSLDLPLDRSGRMTPRLLWKLVQVHMQFGSHLANHPVKHAAAVRYADGVLTVAVDSYGALGELTGSLAQEVEAALRAHTDQAIRLEYQYAGPPLNQEAVEMLRQAEQAKTAAS